VEVLWIWAVSFPFYIGCHVPLTCTFMGYEFRSSSDVEQSPVKDKNTFLDDEISHQFLRNFIDLPCPPKAPFGPLSLSRFPILYYRYVFLRGVFVTAAQILQHLPYFPQLYGSIA
jgi:hypothetical protein